MLSWDGYFSIVDSHIKNKNLVKHCVAVSAAMKALAQHFHENEALWEKVGLMHDADWEETQNEPDNHTKKTVEWLQEAGETETKIIEAVLSHNYTRTGYRQPQSNLEWSLYTCDELTGLIVACALVRPEKTLEAVTVESVLKKFPQKSFAAGVHREQIALCEEKLGIPLPEFIGIVLSGMQKEHEAIGL